MRPRSHAGEGLDGAFKKKKKKKKKIQLIFPRNIFEKDSIKAFATSRE